MTSPAKVAANRRNSRLSTGPTTPQGRAASSQNALKHGVLARQTLLADESFDEYEALARRLLESLDPDGAAEELLVEDVVGLVWGLRRLQRVEVALFSIGLPKAVAQALQQAGEGNVGLGAAFASQAGTFAILSRYETAMINRLRRALMDLERLQRAREASIPALVMVAGGR